MQTQTRPQTTATQTHLRLGAGLEQDFDQLQPPEALVEHTTIPGFLRRIPHRWHIEEIQRFGDKVGRTAEAMQIAYVTTTDRSLGVIRVFPLPLLERIYTIMGAQFGWPSLTASAPPQLGEDPARAARDTIRSHTTMLKHLRTLLDAVESTGGSEITASIATTIHWLEADTARLRAELGSEDEAG